MSIRISVIVQCLAAFCQTVIPTVPHFPADWVQFVHALVGWCQTVLGILAHLSNTDGSSLLPPMKIILKPGE